MGHSSIEITFDRYGYLVPGNEEEAAGLLDDYLARAAQLRDSEAEQRAVSCALMQMNERPGNGPRVL
jgi:hypothetical protein